MICIAQPCSVQIVARKISFVRQFSLVCSCQSDPFGKDLPHGEEDLDPVGLSCLILEAEEEEAQHNGNS